MKTNTKLTRKQIENYLENECAFRDYEFRAAKQFGKVNVSRSINLLTPTQRDLDDALNTFVKDGFGTIVIYVNADKATPKPKRTKYVYSSSSQVFHLWANQSQDSARQGGRLTRAFFNGESCYSYGRHYEVGRIVTYNGVKVAVINTRGYSNTTSKHINEARLACYELLPIVETDDVDLSDVRGALVEMQSSLIDRLMKLFNRKKFWAGSVSFDPWDAKACSEFNATTTKLGHPELVLNVDQDLLDVLNDHIKHRLARQKELDATAEIRRAEKQRIELIKNVADIEAWKTGEKAQATNFIRDMRPQIIRIIGDKVQTSSGAEVPLIDALNLLSLIESGRVQSGDTVGSFNFERFDSSTGIVKIGCHSIELSEARRVLQPSTLGAIVNRSLRLVRS